MNDPKTSFISVPAMNLQPAIAKLEAIVAAQRESKRAELIAENRKSLWVRYFKGDPADLDFWEEAMIEATGTRVQDTARSLAYLCKLAGENGIVNVCSEDASIMVRFGCTI